MAGYFPDVPKIEFEGPETKNPLAFRQYNPADVVGGTESIWGPRDGFPSHHTFLGNQVPTIENLRALDELPAEFQVVVAPMTLADSSAAPTRVFAPRAFGTSPQLRQHVLGRVSRLGCLYR